MLTHGGRLHAVQVRVMCRCVVPARARIQCVSNSCACSPILSTRPRVIGFLRLLASQSQAMYREQLLTVRIQKLELGLLLQAVRASRFSFALSARDVPVG